MTPPAGDPHLDLYQRWAADRHNTILVANFAVPLGIVLRGRVVESGSGKPIQGASVQPQDAGPKQLSLRDVTVRSRQDWTDAKGRFRIVVVPGAGRLRVTPPTGPTAKYAPEKLLGARLRPVYLLLLHTITICPSRLSHIQGVNPRTLSSSCVLMTPAEKRRM